MSHFTYDTQAYIYVLHQKVIEWLSVHSLVNNLTFNSLKVLMYVDIHVNIVLKTTLCNT